ncbi:MAG TPA: cupin domain-containing protein [Capsulimonadaceae bacterium]|jgi:mannose-6-phosphate isomerase-like protein (cupin superfamily)
MKAVVKSRANIVPDACPCGWSQRIVTKDDGASVSFHVVTIKTDSEVHYHKKMTEIYYILKGNGSIYLDGEITPISEGSTIIIPPGVRHRAIGELELINVVSPPFDPSDEYFDGE